MLGIYYKTISFCSLPCVDGSLCNVNKVLSFFVLGGGLVYPHRGFIFHVLKLYNTHEKHAWFVVTLNLDQPSVLVLHLD